MKDHKGMPHIRSENATVRFNPTRRNRRYKYKDTLDTHAPLTPAELSLCYLKATFRKAALESLSRWSVCERPGCKD